MASGLILLLFLAVLCAFFVHQVRRRMGLGVSGRIWMLVIVGFVLIVLTVWVAQTQ